MILIWEVHNISIYGTLPLVCLLRADLVCFLSRNGDVLYVVVKPKSEPTKVAALFAIFSVCEKNLTVILIE